MEQNHTLMFWPKRANYLLVKNRDRVVISTSRYIKNININVFHTKWKAEACRCGLLYFLVVLTCTTSTPMLCRDGSWRWSTEEASITCLGRLFQLSVVWTLPLQLSEIGLIELRDLSCSPMYLEWTSHWPPILQVHSIYYRNFKFCRFFNKIFIF